ncbi:hypothetical protein A4X20_19635 [Mycolicibacterium iranicum]|uniref:Methyltransferase type 11 domain-containing protein n=1 Tax=Mycolicibacterium iranicum TaxID=912594 RepID=A0A178LYJ8_MYCIR|nr:hypothetical protein A4X20_19635 [Mycolicibacterium iranicum]
MVFHAQDAGAELPVLDNQLDVAFLADVLGEVNDKSACLSSLARVLKPRGALIFHETFLVPDRQGSLDPERRGRPVQEQLAKLG